MSFEDSARTCSMITGGDPGYTYAFTIDIPMAHRHGTYRMHASAPGARTGLPRQHERLDPAVRSNTGNFTDLDVGGGRGNGCGGSINKASWWPGLFRRMVHSSDADGLFTDRSPHTYDGRQLMEQRVPGLASRGPTWTCPDPETAPTCCG